MNNLPISTTDNVIAAIEPTQIDSVNLWKEFEYFNRYQSDFSKKTITSAEELRQFLDNIIKLDPPDNVNFDEEHIKSFRAWQRMYADELLGTYNDDFF